MSESFEDELDDHIAESMKDPEYANAVVPSGNEATCPACGHSAAEHWPQHRRPFTACAVCFDNRYYIETRPGCTGLCCYTSLDIAPGCAS